MDLAHKVTRESLRARVAADLAAERDLQTKARRIYAPIASDVKAVLADASVARVYGYEKTLFDFDSKHITKPGNKLASNYLFEMYSPSATSRSCSGSINAPRSTGAPRT